MTRREIVKMFIQSSLGVPYRWGGNNPLAGYDCSGFVCEFLRVAGIWGRNDANSQMLYEHFKNGNGHPGVIQFGTILFFGNQEKISHVAVALNDQMMVEAGGGDQKTTSLEIASQQNAYVRIRRIDSRRDKVDGFLPNEFYYPGGN